MSLPFCECLFSAIRNQGRRDREQRSSRQNFSATAMHSSFPWKVSLLPGSLGGPEGVSAGMMVSSYLYCSTEEESLCRGCSLMLEKKDSSQEISALSYILKSKLQEEASSWSLFLPNHLSPLGCSQWGASSVRTRLELKRRHQRGEREPQILGGSIIFSREARHLLFKNWNLIIHTYILKCSIG